MAFPATKSFDDVAYRKLFVAAATVGALPNKSSVHRTGDVECHFFVVVVDFVGDVTAGNAAFAAVHAIRVVAVPSCKGFVPWRDPPTSCRGARFFEAAA